MADGACIDARQKMPLSGLGPQGKTVGKTATSSVAARALFAENLVHEIGGVPGAELFQEIGSVEIDGTRADAERTCGRLTGGAPDDLRQRNTFFGVKV